MARRLVLVLLLISLLLAGCTSNDELDGDGGGGEPGTGDRGGDDETIDPGVAPAPWEVGNAWTYSTNFGDDITYVVSGNESDDWIVDTTDEEAAWFHARSEISYMGRVRKSDLAGSQGDDRVQYFDFPLEQGKEWTTPWDGVERRVVTVEAGNGSYLFEAYEDDTLVFEYSYEPDAGWFGFITFHTNATQFTIELEGHQTGWTGEVVRWQADKRLDWKGQHMVASGSAAFFNVMPGTEQIWIQYAFRCAEASPGTSSAMLTVTPNTLPERVPLMRLDSCMDEGVETVLEDPEPVEWYASYVVQGSDPEAVLLIDLEIWTRTAERVAVA